MSESGDETGPGHGRPDTDSKVGRVIAEYDLSGTAEWLEAAWVGDGRERRSLRDLADEFNRRALEAAMRDAGMDPVPVEVESAYTTLTDDETSSGARVELRNRLEWEGVDLDTVEADFVTHQAVHTFLRKYRGVERGTPEADPEKARETIGKLRGRTEAVTTNVVERLADRGALSVGSVDALVDVQVVCRDCESQYQVEELIDRGGCDC
ncbi:rod-determining factor RdfA [Salinirubrum litoreum]|uniref:Rod-determining factor RdfA n=1 Tax=Salinirubrum litoreum TaxID=1126234 RepID=A0ABD5RG20_9EURY|nr:rod-determining factor RdfA [Salinirubrum litoreum]